MRKNELVTESSASFSSDHTDGVVRGPTFWALVKEDLATHDGDWTCAGFRAMLMYRVGTERSHARVAHSLGHRHSLFVGPTPVERLNGEIKRRTEVVGIFPNEAAITRLVGAILLEQNDEWSVQRARSMTLETITGLSDDPLVNLPLAAA